MASRLTCALGDVNGLAIHCGSAAFLSSKQLVQNKVINHTHHNLVLRWRRNSEVTRNWFGRRNRSLLC